MTDRELLEYIAAQVGKLTTDVDDLKKAQIRVEDKVSGLEDKVSRIDSAVVRIENVHGEKLSALFDGWNQNTQQLERIEKEVSKHEEVILRRIK